MKTLATFLTGLVIAGPLHALEPAAVTAVAGKFETESTAAQYSARMELYKLINEATAPGKDDSAAVTKVLVSVMTDPAVPVEAKKYLLRAMGNVSTGDAVDMLAKLINGSDALLKDEARQVLEAIRAPGSVAALEAAIRGTSDKRGRIALANSLAMQKAASSVALLAPLTLDPDAEVAAAGIRALAGIGGPEAVETLKKASASGRITPTLNAELENALLIASAGDAETAGSIFESTKSDTVRTAAFLAIVKSGSDNARATAIEAAVKSDNARLRHLALQHGIEMNLASLQAGLAKTIDQMPADDRLVVLANIHHFKPVQAAEKIALAYSDSANDDERIAAISALGKIGTQPAFSAVLKAVGEKSPRINQVSSSALASMNYPEADSELLAMLKGNSEPMKVLAIKAVVVRRIPGASDILIDAIGGGDAAVAKEAVKSLYFTATIDDLRSLCAKAAATSDAARKKSLSGLASKVASRIDSDEARELVARLK